MHTLVTVANPDPTSLTHHVAGRLADALRPGSAEIADLAQEGFDPRWTPTDRRIYREGGPVPADVRAEQERLDRATDLVLVFPVYWWSMPALLKGWIDRVWVTGWAFDFDPQTGRQPRLGGLTTHLLAIAGDAAGTYERHGYETALRTQIQHGILDYCGSPRGAVAFVHESEGEDRATTERSVDAAVGTVVEAIRAREAARG